MATENPQGETAQPTKPTEEQIRAAQELLASAGKYVLGQEDFGRVKGAAAKEAEAKAQALEAELAAIRADHEKAASRLREIDDAGKTKEQLWESQRLELQRLYKERETELAKAREEHAQALENNRALMVDQRLSALLTGSTDPKLALLAARHLMPGKLSVDDHGRLVHVDLAGFESVGEQAESVIAKWWNTQTALRAPSVPAGPPTSGGRAPAATAEIEPYNPPQTGNLMEKIEYARAYKARQAAAVGNSR